MPERRLLRLVPGFLLAFWCRLTQLEMFQNPLSVLGRTLTPFGIFAGFQVLDFGLVFGFLFLGLHVCHFSFAGRYLRFFSQEVSIRCASTFIQFSIFAFQTKDVFTSFGLYCAKIGIFKSPQVPGIRCDI